MADNKKPDLNDYRGLFQNIGNYDSFGEGAAATWLGGNTLGILGDYGHLSQKNAAKLVEFVHKNNRMPLEHEINGITGAQFFGTRGAEFKKSALSYLNEYVESNPELKESIGNANSELKDSKFLASRMFEEGTEENSIYQIALNAQKAQAQEGERATASSERDMQMQLSQSRQQLMDQVRGRRRNLLKSGLSSAQVANEEMQSLLMGQQQAAEVAQQHYGQRQQFQTQAQNAPQNAALQALGMLPEHGQVGAQHAAADAGDYLTQAQGYSKITGTTKQNALDVIQRHTQNNN